jgi:hypothetical protein
MAGNADVSASYKQQHPPREEVRWVSLYKDRLGGGVPGFDRGRLWEEVKPRRYSSNY